LIGEEMTKQIINFGVEGNDATGDALRDAFKKVNDNFTEVYAAVTGGNASGIPFSALSDFDPQRDGQLLPNSIFQVDSNGEYILSKMLVAGEGISITTTEPDPITGEAAITIKNKGARLVYDLNPQLGGDLSGQNNFFIGKILDPDNANADSVALALGTTTDTFAITKGYADSHYVNSDGDTMTGALNVPAGASGTEVPQKQEVVGRAGGTDNQMQGELLLWQDPQTNSDPLTAATKHYVDISGFTSQVNLFVTLNGRTKTKMIADGVAPEKIGHGFAYAFSTVNEACKIAEELVYASSLEPGPYKQPITYGSGANFSIVHSVTSVTVSGVDLVRLAITNLAGSTNVDQGNPLNVDLNTGKLIIGERSKAVGILWNYRGVQSGYDELDIEMVSGTFVTDERLYFDNPTPKIQVAINIESGIYEEHLPIRVPRNVSIIGDEMRRTIIRPKDMASASPWRTMYFYRDTVVDGLTTAPQNYGYHYLVDPTRAMDIGPSYTNAGGYTNAAEIFLANKAFIQAEVNAYMTATYPSVTYDTVKSARDIGLIIDAIYQDLYAGGKDYSVDIASRFLNNAIDPSHVTACIAGMNYVATLATPILNKTTLTSGTTPPKRGVVDQVTDLPDYTTEAAGHTVIANLISTVVYAFNANFNPPKNNKNIDLFLMNDATGLKDFTIQGHGGFGVVLDPEGQILTKSPYIQNCSSIAASINSKVFRGGAFVDGYSGRMPVTITTTLTGTPVTEISVSGLTFPKARPLNSELHRRPNTPSAFFVNGQKYRIEKIVTYDDVAGTATLTLGDAYSLTNTNIVLETAGNRSMLATHFTQVNDLGYGIAVTNNGLMELVSVFTYYCHTAYYSLNGGQIRAVSGSNSNGFFGLKSEGSDPGEIPRGVILADNLTQTAQIYKRGAVFAGAGYNAANSSIATVKGFDYIPYSLTEMQVFHPNGGVTLYTINNVTPISNKNSITFYTKTGTTATYTTSAAHGYIVGDSVTISGISNTQFNGTYTVTGVGPTLTTVTATYSSGGAINTNTVTTGAPSGTVAIGSIVTFSGPTVIAANSTVIGISGNTFTLSNNFTANVGSGTTLTFTAPTAGTQFTVTLATSSVVFNTAAVNSYVILADKIAKLSLGTGITGSTSTFTENLSDGDYVVLRTTQNFKFYGNFDNLSARPSTALDFTYDGSPVTYRTIGLTNNYYNNSRSTTDSQYGVGETLNELSAFGGTDIITVDSNFAYVSCVVTNTAAIAGATTIRILELAPSDVTRVVGMEFGWADQNSGVQKGFKRTITQYVVTSPGSYATITLDSALPANTLIPTQTTLKAGIKAFGSGTLASSIAANTPMTGGGIISLTSSATFSNNGSYKRYVKIDNEVFTFTGVSGNTLTGVTRAQLGTVAALHNGLATVREISGLLTTNISTCRATSHDFLNIGTGGYNTSNYPNNIFGSPTELKVDSASSVDSNGASTKAEVQEKNKGRVFFASTNQDGFFRIGRFFTVDQGTGTVSFNASIVLSNISGLGFERGVAISEFSNDTSMPDLGDAVPTNSAVREYVNRRLGIDLNSNVNASPIGPGFMPRDGSLPATNTMDLGSNRIANLSDPSSGSDAATKSYVDGFLKRTGGVRTGVDGFTMSASTAGVLNMNSNKIINLAAPTDGTDAVNKTYTDNKAQIANLGDVTLSTPVTGNILVYNNVASANKWQNTTFDKSSDVMSAYDGTTLTSTIQGARVTTTYTSGGVASTTLVVGDTTGIIPGMVLTGVGFTTGQTVVSVTNSTTVVLNAVANGTPNASGTLYFTRDGAVNNAKVSASAAIAQTKLALSNAVATTSSSISVTNATSNGTTATLTFAAQPLAPFANGTNIVVTGISPSNYNGTYSVTGCTTTTVTYANPLANGAYVSGGSVSAQQGIGSFDSAQFTVTNGFASIKANGVALTRLEAIGTGNMIGNNSGNTQAPIAMSFQAGIDAAITGSGNVLGAGVLTRGSTASYSVTAATSTNSSSSLVLRDSNGNIAVNQITVSSSLKRSAAGTGYLDGNYTVAEVGGTTGVIYTIGGTYLPSGTNLGTMYGIGYAFTNTGAARTTLNNNNNTTGFGTASTGLGIPDNLWGQYVAAAGNVTVFLGADGVMYGTATKARYADLAENYAADQKYEPGTVLMIGGEQEVTLAKGQGTRKVVGVVSTNPAYQMNMGIDAEFPVAIALQGRVPCKVVGKISKGDMLVVGIVPGVAMASEDPRVGSVIGKALEDYDSDRIGMIEVLVGKH
jgi:hypothetical protein